MYILSIDIGIKHLAHCLFRKENEITIVEWGVVNLMKPAQTCSGKRTPCGKRALFSKDGQGYCGIHAKHCGIPLPRKELAHIKSKSLPQLHSLCTLCSIPYTNEPKAELLTLLQAYQERCLIPIAKEKTKEYTAVDLGFSLQHHYDRLFHSYTMDHVVVENQIGPLASKMKCLQGMVMQYWIMKGVKHIHGVSSTHKLNFLQSTETTYAGRKKESIVQAKKIIADRGWAEWESVFSSHPKKDDLSDTLLQGLWFISTLDRR